MNNNKDNLGEFLRKKFAEVEGTDEAWSKPSLEVRNSVLDQITATPKKKRKKAILFFLLFLGIAVGIGWFEYFRKGQTKEAASIYTDTIAADAVISDHQAMDERSSFVPKKLAGKKGGNGATVTEFSKDELITQNALLRTVIQNQNDIINELKGNNLTVDKNTIDHNKSTQKVIATAPSNTAFEELLKVNNQLKIEHKQLEILNKNQKEKINVLQHKNQLLLDSLNRQMYASNSTKAINSTTTAKSNIVFKDIEPLTQTELEGVERLVEPVRLEEGFGLDKPKRKIQFELGYQLGFRGRMAEVIEYVEEQGLIRNQIKDKFLLAHVHGLSIGISPVKNFWIKTGAHVGNVNLHQKHQAKLVYNSNSVTAFTGLAYADNINSLSNRGINTLNNNVDALANAQGVVNGDDLDLNFQTNLVLTSLQIPLEFNYLYGKKQLQALFQLGGQWNILNYQYYMHSFGTTINNQNYVNLSQARSNPEKNSVQYWGLHAGIGMSYNISKHFTFQGLFSYEYYFQDRHLNLDTNTHYSIPGASQKKKNPISNMRFGLKLGLNYRF